jgi:ATP-dependent Lon protease
VIKFILLDFLNIINYNKRNEFKGDFKMGIDKSWYNIASLSKIIKRNSNPEYVKKRTEEELTKLSQQAKTKEEFDYIEKLFKDLTDLEI